MKSSVSLLTTPTVDTTGTAVLLTFDDKRYLFGNIHEGLQRVCIQNATRLGKLNTLFLTGKTEWRNTGGLLGFILTAADVWQGAADAAKESILESQRKWEKRFAEAKSQEARDAMIQGSQPISKLKDLEPQRLSIFGGENVMQLLATARRFIFRKGLPLDIHELADRFSTLEPTWQDDKIQVWSMPLQPLDTSVVDLQPQRKRSFDEYLDETLGDTDTSDLLIDRKSKLKGVVSDMFDSNWRMDALFETPLAEVQLPAALFVRDPVTKKLQPYRGPMPGTDQDISGVNVLVRKPWPGALVTNLPPTKPSSVSMSYIIRNHTSRGKFDRELAAKCGIKPGPLYRRLASGESVVNENGETITPEQVMGPPQRGKGFAVIELPTVDYLSSLMDQEVFNHTEVMEDIVAIFWLLGSGVTKDPVFQELTEKYPDVKHIISSPDHCANYLTIDSAAAAQLQHRAIDGDRFSIPLHNNRTEKLPPRISDCVIAQRGIQIELAPELKITTTMEPGLLNTFEVVKKMRRIVVAASQEARRLTSVSAFKKEHEAQSLPDSDTEIITLGTGSAVPSKQRNVSATLIRVPNVGSYLLDAGENTLGQLARMYSPEELKAVLKDLKMIWISHMHADHHLGMTSVIKAWHNAVYGSATSSDPPITKGIEHTPGSQWSSDGQQRLCVVAEMEMIQWLQEYSEIEEFGYDKILALPVLPANIDQNNQILRTTCLLWNKESVAFQDESDKSSLLKKVTGLSNLQSVYVTHCAGARAVALTWPSGLKISYSGDCRPSERFTIIGKGSTVLIHEATFDDLLRGDAVAKKHSTTREAIGVGLKMQAKRIILTHFSQRYSKLPELENVVARPVRFEDPDLTNSAVGQGEEPERTTAAMDENRNTDEIQDETSAKDTIQKSSGTHDDEPLGSSTPSRPSTGMADVEIQAAKDIKIGVAFDLMRVKVKDIIALEKYKVAFQTLYEPQEDPNKAARHAEAAALLKEKAELKQARHEARRQKQIEATDLKRKASQSSMNID